MKAIICLIGNDGTGKTSVANYFNSKYPDIRVVERSGEYKDLVGGISIPDKMTLLHTFEEGFDQFEILSQINEVPVFWVILDCDVSAILNRIKIRQTSDIWETEKALHYFRNRFRQLGAHFGIPMIDTTSIPLETVYERVFEIIQFPIFYQEYRKLGTKYLTYDLINNNDIEKILFDLISPTEVAAKVATLELPEYSKEFLKVDVMKLYIRWYINNHQVIVTENAIKIGEYTLPKKITFLLKAEGESKKVYVDVSNNPYTKDLAFICLKSTIYSHSMQATGTIEGLGEIRATGTQLYLEMMWRNGLNHSYHSINKYGIIISDWIDCPPLEIVVKRFCEGTDKHSFHNMRDEKASVIPVTGEYLCGPYMRTDWRNPNHVDSKNNKLNSNIYYYLFEELLGKEEFLKKILQNPAYSKPFGDKCVPEDIVCDTMDLDETRKSVFKIFTTIQAYFNKVGLLVKDACFMLNKEGTKFWSEINQDCMRIVTTDGTDKFDKDLWRTGGSSSKEQICKKWIEFNNILKNYFIANRFHETELINYNSYPYQAVVKEILNNPKLNIPTRLLNTWTSLARKQNRRFILTMDMFDGKPVLVQSGVVTEIHTEGNFKNSIQEITLHPDVLVVDLNGAMNTNHLESPNREIIKKLGVDHYIHTGGGLRTLADVQDMLESSVRRVVLGSASDELIQQVPKERLIVEVTVNELNEVLIHGRKTNTHVSIFERLNQLSELGVNAVSITFHQTEGHLNGIPRDQIRDLVLKVPRPIKKIIIAGGISTLDDLEFLWSFDRVIPQLGSAIWKRKLTIGQVVAQSLNYDQNKLIPAVIQDINGTVKGLIYMNKEAVVKTCDERFLWRFSRQEKQLMMKGATSGDIQCVLAVSADCDSDTLLVTVDSEKPMCHTSNFSCFPMQTVAKASVAILRDHLKERINTNSYSGKMQQKPALALAKVMEEFWEIVTAPFDAQIHEVSDMFIHLIMYLNGINIKFEDVLNELNRRRWNPHLVDSIPQYKRIYNPNEVIIGITGAKYSGKTDNYVEEYLGIRVTRGDGRSLLVTGEIVDQEKYSKFFGTKTFCFITARPKDMAWLMAVGRIGYAVTYETAIKNFPEVYKPIHEVVDPSIALCLIKRKGEIIDPKTWSVEKRVLIAAEHVRHVSSWMEKQHIPSEHVHLDRIIGSSEGFLLQTNLYTLCDAVVESGKTLEDNNLEIFETIIPKGHVLMGLYERI